MRPDDTPNYSDLAQKLGAGSVIPFLGAGASLCDRPEDHTWTIDSPYYPTGSDLSRYLADRCGFEYAPHHPPDLAKVASFFLLKEDELELWNCLHSVFIRAREPSLVHRWLARLPDPLLIVTTNYDNLIEQAFVDQSRDFRLVVHSTNVDDNVDKVQFWEDFGPGANPEFVQLDETRLKLNPAGSAVERRPLVYKMHGNVHGPSGGDLDSFVISEEHYVDFLSRMIAKRAIPHQVGTSFLKRRFLFLGYGLNDWNFRVMLKNLSEFVMPGTRSLARRSWAIQKGPSNVDRVLWDSRLVSIHDLDLADFVGELSRRMGIALGDPAPEPAHGTL
jgi:NAD-dependent SIR2 family protein deacetylase